MTQPSMRIAAAVLGAPEARELAQFYSQLLGWTIAVDEDGWVMLDPAGRPFCLFATHPE